MAAEFVRVKGPDGVEFYTTERGQKATGATVVDKPAYDQYGRLVPIKPNINKGGVKSASTQKDG